MARVKNLMWDSIEREGARRDGVRVCDDCDFVTEDRDCIVCPDCRGSVA